MVGSRADAPAPPGGNLSYRGREGRHPRPVVVRGKRKAGTSSAQLPGLRLTWESGGGMFLWRNTPREVGGAGYRFPVPSSGQCPQSALDKDVFTGIWEQGGVLPRGPPDDDRTAPGQGRCVAEVSQEAWEGSGEVLLRPILLTI